MVTAVHLFPTVSFTDSNMMPPPEARNIFDAFNPESEDAVLIVEIPEFTVDEQLNATRKMPHCADSPPSGRRPGSSSSISVPANR